MLKFKMDELKKQLRRNEGDRLDVYPDTQGIWTVGNGFNLERADARRICETCGIPYDSLMSLKGTGRGAITDAQREMLLDYCIAEVIPQVEQLIPGFDQLSGSQQMALIDLAWAGIGMLSGFRRMLHAIEKGNWANASEELLNSRLAKQWGDRAKRDALLLQSAS